MTFSYVPAAAEGATTDDIHPVHEILLAEARLSAPPASRLVKYHDLPALEREKRQFHEFVTVDLAHTVMLAEEGIISPAAGRAILRQLLAIGRMPPADFPVDVRKGSLFDSADL